MVRPFLNNREIDKDEAGSKKPYTSRTEENVEIIKTFVRSECRSTGRTIGSELNISHRIVRTKNLCKDASMNDNIPSHSALFVNKSLAKKGILVIP